MALATLALAPTFRHRGGQRTKRLERLELLGSRQCGWRGGAALQVIYLPRYRVIDPDIVITPISVYSDIDSTLETMSCVFGADIRISRYCLQYRIHIGADIGEKPDIGGGNKPVNRYIGHDIGSDIEKNADIGSNLHDIGGGKKRVCADMYPISCPISSISDTIS